MIEHIKDPSDSRLLDYRELKDAGARRKLEGNEFFVAEGMTAIGRTIASGHRIRSVLVSEQKFERFEALLKSLEAPVFVVNTEVLRQIAGFDMHRGAIASADRRTPPSLLDIAQTARRIAIVEASNDPENIGAIARSARAFGIEALLLDPTCIDPYTRRSVRVSMGEILFLQICRVTDVAEALGVLHTNGFESWAMTPTEQSTDIWTLDVPEKLAVLLGAEGPGLTTTAIQQATRRVRLPINADVDSLNVAAAAAVTFAIVNRAKLIG